MKVFVIGATGAVGRPSVSALVAARHEVTAVARTPEKAADLTARGAIAVTVSIFDRDALTDAFVGQDAVVNLATAIPPMTKFTRTAAWRENDRVRIEGSTAVVDAAIAAHVPRLLQESVSMLYPDGGSDWINEDVAPDRFPMARGNLAAEQNANRFADAGGVGVVLRLGWFYGPGARHSEQLFALARNHIGVIVGPPRSYVSSIHMADAGAAVAAALYAPGGTYNIVDDEPLTKREYAEALTAAAGRSAWIRVPGRLSLLLGDRLTSLTRSLRVSNARFRQATDWRPEYPSAREGWLATAQVVEARRTGRPCGGDTS